MFALRTFNLMSTAAANCIRPFPASLSVCALRGDVKVMDQCADEWRNLCAESENDQPFYRPEWIGAHIRAFSPAAKIVLITTRLNGRLHLVLPLLEEKSTFSKVPVRKLRAPVSLHCGRFDVVRSAGPEGDEAVDATWDYLRKSGGWDMLQLNYTPRDGTSGHLAALARADGFHTTRVPERPSPYIPIPYEPGLWRKVPPNSKLRSQLTQVYKRLGEGGALRLRRIDAADPAALDRFYQLEASGWKGRDGSAIACNRSKKQFFDEIARCAAAHGYFALYMLEWKGQLMAAHFSLVLQGRCYSPKVAYDEQFRQFAPGHLIINEILKDCAARRIVVLDIMGEDDAWKMKWTSQACPVDHYMVFNGPRGKLAYNLGLRFKPAIGRLFQRKS